MPKNKLKEVLKKQISLIKPSKEEQEEIKKQTDKFIKNLNKKIKNKKIKAEVFVGGSVAKETLIKKPIQDIDVFLRFDKKYHDKEISIILEKIVGKSKNVKKIHGSRDYFQASVKGNKKIIFEVVPVLKISKPEEAKNVTDLSYFHVNYVKNKINKNKKLSDEILLSKNFCHAQNCYGAESYIHGFSGYALELLIIHYKGFLNFIKAVAENKGEQIIIDPAKHYKKKNEILLELNESKLQSPIVFVDPTFKLRNALAALSKETFEKFKTACKKFLKNPSKKAFEKKEINENKFNLIILTKTNKPKRDIAGSKLKKFHDFFSGVLNRNFEILGQDFRYDENKNLGKNYFFIKPKKERIIEGPPITSVKHLTRFKKAHNKKNNRCFIKNQKAFARKKLETNPKKFLENFKKRDKKRLKEMNVTSIKIK